MVAVIAILATLLTAGISLLNGTSAQARKTATDTITGMIEQARTRAITSRTQIVLAIAEPGDLPAGDERCRLALFRVNDWPPAGSTAPVEAVLLTRWQTLETGIVLLGGEVDGIANPLDGPELTLNYGGAKELSVTVHAIAFHSRGGLLFPAGSTPVALRIAEGGYRGGVAQANRRQEKAITENLLKIGRVTARPYRIDG